MEEILEAAAENDLADLVVLPEVESVTLYDDQWNHTIVSLRGFGKMESELMVIRNQATINKMNEWFRGLFSSPIKWGKTPVALGALFFFAKAELKVKHFVPVSSFNALTAGLDEDARDGVHFSLPADLPRRSVSSPFFRSKTSSPTFFPQPTFSSTSSATRANRPPSATRARSAEPGSFPSPVKGWLRGSSRVLEWFRLR